MDTATKWQPKFDKKDLLGTVADVGEAMTRYYRPDRQNRHPGERESLISSRESVLSEDGWFCLASRHESLTGHALWVRSEAGVLAVYQ